MRLLPFSLSLLLPIALLAQQPVEVVAVRQQAAVERETLLPGEILPYQRVTLQARANGYVERILVDRGSVVRQGQVIATLNAPEVTAQVAEAESRVQIAESARAEAEARLAAAQATYARLKEASTTAGAIAGNELVQAEKTVDAARAAVQSAESTIRAAQAVVRANQQALGYLQVTAPFSGIITERYVHPGALVGPGSHSAGAIAELEQVSRLRVVVPVPETSFTSVRRGTRISFRVPAYPDRTFTGTVARIDRSLDPKTRTMPIELDVANPRSELSPGMFPQVNWPASRAGASLLVPPTAVVTTTERTFVIRLANNRAEWVDVRRGNPAGDAVEVFGALQPGDLVVQRATDELRAGTRLSVKKAAGKR